MKNIVHILPEILSRILKLSLFSLLLGVAISGNADFNRDLIEKNIKNIDAASSVTKVSESEIDQIYEIELNGSNIIYSSNDGSYVIVGKLLDISGQQVVDITEQRLQSIREGKLDSIDIDSTITFPSSINKIGEVYIFTDITCAYCVNFHRNIKKINDLGITVHYLAFPRSGQNSSVAETMDAIWCSSSRGAALTAAIIDNINPTPHTPCASPLSEHYRLALELGVNGTPAIFDPHGRRLGGYLSPEQLYDALN